MVVLAFWYRSGLPREIRTNVSSVKPSSDFVPFPVLLPGPPTYRFNDLVDQPNAGIYLLLSIRHDQTVQLVLFIRRKGVRSPLYPP